MTINVWNWLTLPFRAPLPSGTANSPTTESPTVAQWKNELYLCRTLYGGWECVAAQANNLLPQHPKETAENYKIRLKRPTFYNAFGRTVRGLSGTVFKNPPTPEGIPTEILDVFEDDIDLQGTDGIAFCHHGFNDALITGLAGIFVDMPEVTSTVTLLEAQQLDIRPFWTLIRKDDIVSFRVDVVNGKTVLGQLVFRECVQQRRGDFGVADVVMYRVLRRTETAVTFESWGPSTDGKIVRQGEVRTLRGPTEIPFAPIYTARQDFMNATPPLLDLANLNLLHYQVNSDMHHAIHVANVPFLFAAGFDVEEMDIGPNSAVGTTEESGKVSLKWMETQGSAIGSTRAVLADIEEQMSNLGLGMLQRKSRAAETAEKAAIDKGEQDTTLGAMVSDLEDAIELALYYHAQFAGDPEGKGGKLVFSRQFETEPVAADRNQNQGGPSDPRDPTRPGATNNARTSQPA